MCTYIYIYAYTHQCIGCIRVMEVLVSLWKDSLDHDLRRLTFSCKNPASECPALLASTNSTQRSGAWHCIAEDCSTHHLFASADHEL